jgi:hypothetical protein
MSELEKYEMINSCETVEALSKAILRLTDPTTGFIQGRIRKFDGVKMASVVGLVVNQNGLHNWLTREYGIRQQALYLKTLSPTN